MIGNDVVDLADPEAREGALHPRFDARVFAPEELARLAAAADRGRLRWALWAAKEAAYKAARQLEPGLAFHPRELVVRRGRVRVGGRSFRVRISERAGALHAVALQRPAPGARVAAGVAELAPGEDAGAAARALALRAAARALGAAPEELAAGREGRVPRLLRRGVPCGSLSLSHHGRFAAFALRLAPAEAPR